MLNINTNIIDTRFTLNQSTDEFALTIEYKNCELEVNFRANVNVDENSNYDYDFDSYNTFKEVEVKSISVERKASLLSDNGLTTFNINKNIEKQIERIIEGKLQDQYLLLTA